MYRSSAACLFRVGVLGAAGGIGQSLSLLLKNNPLVSELSLYDLKGAPGIAADLSHVCSPAKVTGYAKDKLHDAVQQLDLALIVAGVPRRPGMTRDDLFTTNARIVMNLTKAIGQSSPRAMIGVIANPVNSTMPVAVETLRKLGLYDPARVFGITTLDLVRARTFVAGAIGKSPYDVDVPVIGGHSGDTIVPLLSGFSQLSEAQAKAVAHRIQFAGEEVVKAKAGAGSATLSMAYAASEWSNSVLKALRGDVGVVECSMVECALGQPSCRFLSTAYELGTGGVSKVLPLPKMNETEKAMFAKCLVKLGEEQQKGIDFGVKTHIEPDG